MLRLRAMRDTLGFELTVLAVGMIGTVIGLILITNPGALS